MSAKKTVIESAQVRGRVAGDGAAYRHAVGIVQAAATRRWWSCRRPAASPTCLLGLATRAVAGEGAPEALERDVEALRRTLPHDCNGRGRRQGAATARTARVAAEIDRSIDELASAARQPGRR
jgi:hypothetical protein